MRVIIVIMMVVFVVVGTSSGQEIILTSEKLINSAYQLQEIHEKVGIQSDIVTVEQIWDSYSPVEDPLVSGYSTEQVYDSYNYTLALKIISFLRTVNASYVTILGDADIVPPSYYAKLIFYEPFPTDFFYASPDYDLKPDFAVGRIPAGSEDEAEKVLGKINDWLSDIGSGNYVNAALIGMRIYAAPYSIERETIDDYEVWQGETAVKLLEDLGFTETFNTTIALQSDEEWTSVKQTFDEALSGGYGVVFHVGHGIPYALDSDDGGMYTTRYMNMLDKRRPLLPVVLSSGCSAAAFDEEIRDIYLPNWAPGLWSEFLLTNDAGGIAFVGFTGTTGSDYQFSESDGFVEVAGVKHADNILIKTLKNLPGNRLGDAFKAALEEVKSEENIKLNPSTEVEEWKLRVYLEAELIGDPVLKYPAVSWRQPESPPEIEVLSQPLNGVYKGEVSFRFDRPVSAKVFYLESRYLPDRGYSIFGELVEKAKDVREYTFTPPYEGKYLLRVSDGKRESWFAFKASPVEELKIEYPENVTAYVGQQLEVKIEANMGAGCSVVSAPAGVVCENMTLKWTPASTGVFKIVFEVTANNQSVQGELEVNVREIEIKAVSPPNGSTGLPLDVELCASLSRACNVEFLTSSGSAIGSGDGTDVCVSWSGLEEGRVYQWMVRANCSGVTYESETWWFRTSYRPVADFSFEVNGSVVSFTSTSTDADGQKLMCLWDFGDGSRGEGCSTAHSYGAGSYTVTLTVVDEAGLSSSISKVVGVVNDETSVELPADSKDLDGDGLYEDINGDGKLDFEDIAYFQWHFKEPQFQDYVSYYDFKPDGTINTRDVLELYVYWKWGVKRW
jgi:PKD repeat protein